MEDCSKGKGLRERKQGNRRRRVKEMVDGNLRFYDGIKSESVRETDGGQQYNKGGR